MATNNEEIIERKEGSPVATSCLVIAVVAILGAIALQIAELAQIRTEYVALEKTANQVSRVTGDIVDIDTRIQDILDGSTKLTGEGANRVKAANERGEQLKKDAEAEAKNPGQGSDSEPEEAPEEPAEEPEEPADEPDEPAEEPEEAADEPDEPAEEPEEPADEPEEPAEEDAGDTGDSLEDL